jgi:folate-binding protein YgfZ
MEVRKSARIRPDRPRKRISSGLGKLRKNIIMQKGWRVVAELGLGILRARGADAISFLQGQLSNDTTRLESGRLQLSGYHTPQGRAIALLRLTPLAPDDVLAILPRELVPLVVARLKRYVLRAKVQITDESPQWQIRGYQGPAPAVPAGALCLPYGSSRQLVLIPISPGPPQAGPQSLPEANAVAGTPGDWAAGDIAEGLPQVYLPTSEAFVAQMLNLDVTDGIALDKGCYTGQEIIARAHYRGQVKRRMQRFVSHLPCALHPGESGILGDGRAFKVVETVTLADGRCEFLAVANPATGVGSAPELREDTEAAAPTQTPFAVDQLALPYELPAPRTGSGP